MAANGLFKKAQQRELDCWHSSIYSLSKIFLLYGTVLVFVVAGIDATQLQPQTHTKYPSHSRICSSVDIRNNFPKNDSLKGCRVVEGFVQILLFDNVNETEMSTRSYPELREITDYLLLYRVNGLRSVGQLFPNLAVIRGRETFFSNALVIFEMSSLQEIGLYSLTDITHGLVRIDKNPSMCFVDSIDWNRITHEKGDHSIDSSKPENECPICPGGDTVKEDGEASVACHVAPKTQSDYYEREKYLCWNRQHCQKICPDNCTSCNDKGECCNPLCIGGCSNDDVNNCTVCRNFTMGFGDEQKCMVNCPPNYYKFLDRRCITREECINTRKPFEIHPTTEIDYPYKIFQDQCVLHCPPNYMNDYINHTCKPCAGKCKKECPGSNVDSISTAQQLRGCTHITGSLEIQIRGGKKVVSELEENLSMIEEINGYLKIVRSFPLVSLSFLKSLKRIRGQNLGNEKSVFIVLDNQNLQELWDWTNRTLEIDNKERPLFFHFNPKLCLSKIRMLRKKAKLREFTELEVASKSNGDKVACDVTTLNVEVVSIKNKIVLLQWEGFKLDDQRKLLGYIVYSIEAQHRNITLYDGKDACGEDDWRVDDVAIPDANSSKVFHLLTQLKPYTQYAFYVKTYTIATESKGAQSDIQYFRTLPSEPSPPQNLQVVSNSSSSLKATWFIPRQPNGNITHYIISGKKHDNGYMDSKDRNYCKDHPTTTPIPKPPPPPILPPKNNNSDSCSCEDNKHAKKGIDEMEVSARIKFENELHNQVYVKRDENKTRKKRDNSDTVDSTPQVQNNKNNNEIQNLTENGTDVWESFSYIVYGKTEFYISNLHHFTTYEIYVQACREKQPQKDEYPACSSKTMVVARTQMKVGADNISKVQITNQSLDTVTVSWEQPKDPNGMIFRVTIEYKRLDLENMLNLYRCITMKYLSNGTMAYTIDKLTPGNYSLRLLVQSSAGKGQYSNYVYFDIPQPSSSPLVISAIVIGVFVFFGILVAYIIMARKRQKEKESMRLIQTVNPEYVPSVYEPDEWEVPRKKIELLKELGQGSFGMVYEGVARDIKGKSQIRCAIKTVNEHATNRERLEFLNEASVMKAFDTAHVVRLLGVVSQGQPTLVIMELMANGDLKTFLRSHRPDAETYDPSSIKHPPTLKQIYQMAIEIADGMAYLSAKKFVHRDLAARNCMVAEDLTVKIGDFGMTRDIYETDYYRKGTKGLLPVRWMAPESLKDGVFTSSSDVWSYGVVLWEMATLALQPYQGLSHDQVLRYVIDGGVMERPENCPDKLYTLMRYCWQHKPLARPTFIKLCSLLLDDARTTFAQVSFYHSAAGIEARTSRPTPPSPSQDDQTTPLRKADGLGYTPSDSQDSDTEIDIDTNTHIHFPSISEDRDIATATANGYVSGCPTNGAATTQC